MGALNDKVNSFDKTCVNYMKVLSAAEGASLKMTTHTEADAEVAALKEVQQGQGSLRRLGQEVRGPGEGVGPARQHRHRAQLLGGQGQVRGGREPVLSGEDGVHPGRAQEHLPEGEAGGEPVNLMAPFNIGW